MHLAQSLPNCTFAVSSTQELNLARVCLCAERALRYMPFADGIRTCVGQALARTTMPLVMAAQLGRYSFELAKRVSPITRSLGATRQSVSTAGFRLRKVGF